MNPLYNALLGTKTALPGLSAQSMGISPMNNMSAQMSQLKANPAQAIRSAGYNVPDEIINNPQATVMHLLQTGQIGGAAMQRIQPILSMLTGK